MTPEGKVKDQIKGWLKANGAYQLWPVQTGYGAATVDALLCINGRFIGLETKRPGRATPTPRQRIVMDAIEAAGGWAFCVDSLDEFLRQVRGEAVGRRALVDVIEGGETVRAEPYVKFIFDELKSRKWPPQGKQITSLLLEHHLSTTAIRAWKDGCVPKLETWLGVLDGLGYEIMIVAKEPVE